MLLEVLATESRMVIHVAIGTVEALIFGSLSIKVKGLFDPCHIPLLIWLGHLFALDHWAISITSRIQEGLFDIHWTKVSPWHSLFEWIRSIC